MNKLLGPTSIRVVLVVTAFISILLLQSGILVDSAGAANCTESLRGVLDFHSRFTDPASTMRAAWAEPSKIPGALGARSEFLAMKGPSEERVSGLISVNSALKRRVVFDGALEASKSNVNSMDIEVSKITVIAINTVKGGNAIATSDITLSPVQSMGSSSRDELEEKLK
jgi:hypothetical protein